MITYQITPIQEIEDLSLRKAGVRLLIKREDLNHPEISGNKWWKLKYNLAEAICQEKDTLLTFGGSHSNHIYATAAAANILGLRSIGIIRGEESFPLNPTLAFARSKGMQLHYLDRESYREKSDPEKIEEFRTQFGDFFLIPEGGTNELAVKGCKEFGEQLRQESAFDYLCLPVGTGGTMAGMIEALGPLQTIIGFSALKGGGFLEGEVHSLINPARGKDCARWRIETGYHFGGYAKVTKKLREFILLEHKKHGLPLDLVYTAKTLFGIYDLVRKNEIPEGSVILMLHTGGLQGSYLSE